MAVVDSPEVLFFSSALPASVRCNVTVIVVALFTSAKPRAMVIILRFLCLPLPAVTIVFQMTVREPPTGASKCVLNTPVLTSALMVFLPDGCAMARNADLICVEEIDDVVGVLGVVGVVLQPSVRP